MGHARLKERNESEKRNKTNGVQNTGRKISYMDYKQKKLTNINEEEEEGTVEEAIIKDERSE